MLRPIIDDKHRQKRIEYLAQFNLQNGPDNRPLLDAETEFGQQLFTTQDLYDLYLTDFAKTLPPAMAGALKMKGGVIRSFAQAHAAASSHSLMLVYLMLKGTSDDDG